LFGGGLFGQKSAAATGATAGKDGEKKDAAPTGNYHIFPVFKKIKLIYRV